MFEALLQLFVPGEEHIGPVSPTGNHPVYKVKSSSWIAKFVEIAALDANGPAFTMV